MCFYSQDLISSTLEPLSEFMPSTTQDIDFRSQHVFVLDSVPYFRLLQYWNLRVLRTQSATDIMDAIKQNPNYFALTPRSNYMSNIMVFNKPTENEDWLWRLSPNEITSFKPCIVHRKYEPWSERIRMELLHIDVCISTGCSTIIGLNNELQGVSQLMGR